MDLLPLEMVLELSRHLTDRDVIACSAVCWAWREIFNDDVVWKPRCSLKEREEYLRTTPSVVEPTFPDQMGSGDTTLSAPCHWRLARLREEHLRNNWRNGRRLHRRIERDANYGDSRKELHGFLTDDVVFVVYNKYVEFFDVSAHPVVKVAEIPFGYTLQFYQIKTIRFIGDNQWVLANASHLGVYHVDIESKTISLKFKFQLAADINDPDVYFEIKYAVIGTMLVALVRGDGRLHVWDLASGNKLKEDDVDAGRILVGLVGSETSDYVAVISSNCNNTEPYSYSVYSTNTLSFLQFHYTSELGASFTHLHTCVVHKQFIAIRVHQHTLVFDCNSCSLLFQGCHSSYEPWNIEIVNNSFMFTQNGKLMTYNPVTNSQATFDIEASFIEGEDVIEFIDLKGNFIAVTSDYMFPSLVFELSENGLLRVNLSFTHESIIPIAINKSRSRMLYNESLEDWEIDSMEEAGFYVVANVNSFW